MCVCFFGFFFCIPVTGFILGMIGSFLVATIAGEDGGNSYQY